MTLSDGNESEPGFPVGNNYLAKFVIRASKVMRVRKLDALEGSMDYSHVFSSYSILDTSIRRN